MVVQASARAPAMERQMVDRHPIVEFRSCAKPHYPAADLAQAHTGTVTLGFQIAADGHVVDSGVWNSSGHEGLDLAAQDAIKKCKFVPAMANGKAVQSWTKVQYIWTLE
jgi:TonB family protein